MSVFAMPRPSFSSKRLSTKGASPISRKQTSKWKITLCTPTSVTAFGSSIPPTGASSSLRPTSSASLSPPESPTDIFQDNVVVNVGETNLSLREQVDSEMSQLPSVFPNWTSGQPYGVTVANLPAERLQLAGQMGPDLRNNQPEMMLTQMTVVWVMKGKRIYRIEYTAEGRAYAKFMPQFQAMLESFELS